MLLPVWKWHWNSRRKILARFCETLKQSYTQMKAAIPDSINIKNHFWAPVKLYCFPPGLDRFDPQAQQAGEDSPTALRASRAARGPAARREVPCCHLQSGYHQRDLCLLSLLTDNTLFPLSFSPLPLRKLELFTLQHLSGIWTFRLLLLAGEFILQHFKLEL